jgi:hypothetical protein
MAKEPAIKPMPFPGESPTVALAMAAGQKYGLHEEEAKPARAKPRKKAATRKASPTGKAASTRKAAPKRKSAGAKKKAAR